MSARRVVPRRWGLVHPSGRVMQQTTGEQEAERWRKTLLRGWAVIRVCGCGCGTSMEGRDVRAVCVDSAHKARAWATVTGYVPPGRRTVRPDGRKRVDPTKTIRVSPEHHARAAAAAERNGLTMRAYTEAMIDRLEPPR